MRKSELKRLAVTSLTLTIKRNIHKKVMKQVIFSKSYMPLATACRSNLVTTKLKT